MEGWSGADIEQLVKHAVMAPLRILATENTNFEADGINVPREVLFSDFKEAFEIVHKTGFGLHRKKVAMNGKTAGCNSRENLEIANVGDCRDSSTKVDSATFSVNSSSTVRNECASHHSDPFHPSLTSQWNHSENFRRIKVRHPSGCKISRSSYHTAYESIDNELDFEPYSKRKCTANLHEREIVPTHLQIFKSHSDSHDISTARKSENMKRRRYFPPLHPKQRQNTIERENTFFSLEASQHEEREHRKVYPYNQ